ncbi:16106_t:CDS:2, partial [Gigaspora margarita]
VEVPMELKNMFNELTNAQTSYLHHLSKTNNENNKAAFIHYSLIDRLAIQYFQTLRAGPSSESSSFVLHKIDGKQPDIYLRDDILNIEPGNIEITRDSMIQDAVKYDLDTNKSLRENIYEIQYTYDNLPTSKKRKFLI